MAADQNSTSLSVQGDVREVIDGTGRGLTASSVTPEINKWVGRDSDRLMISCSREAQRWYSDCMCLCVWHNDEQSPAFH